MSLQTEQIKERHQVAEDDQWNLLALYPSFDEWEKEFSSILENSSSPYWPSLSHFRNRLNEGPEILYETLESILGTSRRLEKLYTYAHLKHDEEITNDHNKACFQKISSLLHDFQQEIAWFEPEILSLPVNLISTYLEHFNLQTYRFYLEKTVRMRPHTLSADKEELLAMAGKALQTSPKAFSALNNADFKFNKVKDSQGEEHELTHGLFQLYLRSEDRQLRKNAFETLHAKFAEFENTLCELIYGEIQNHVFYARARKYKSSLEAALFPKKIAESVYTSLIQAVRKGLPSLHRYIRLRKKFLNLPEIHLYDMYVPLVSHVDMKMDYLQAEELVIESSASLGKDYQSLLYKGMKQEKWVDRYENKNKRSGAYSSGCFDSFPYILMNYRGILKDVFTLAHEAGHSMHSQLARMHQPYHYAHYPIFVAEVASTFNEELLMHLLLQRTTRKEEKLFLINEKIEDIRGTLFRQTMFAEFELRLHEYVEKEIPLTPQLLKETYRSLNKDYFGPEVAIDFAIDYEWSRIPHFYYNFYVYQYATGISAALALSEKVLSGDEKCREDYLTFLKKGGSLYPIDLLKIAGVDMSQTFAVDATVKKFDSLVTELESLAE